MIDKREIGDFEILKAIGRGPSGVVYQARDRRRGQTVALKTIPLPGGVSPGDEESLQRGFLAGAAAAAAFTHPGLVTLLEGGVETEARVFYLAFEMARGRTLAALLSSREALDWRDALRTASALAAALEHVHGRGLIHGAVNPANVMMSPDGPRLMDTGGAGLVSHPTAAAAWRTDRGHLSPEQALGLPMDGRSDVFSLGAVLYEHLTGRPAFDAPTPAERLTRLAYESPAPLAQLVPTLPPALEAVVSRALAKRPEDRYPEARSLREDLEDLLGGRPPRHASPPLSGTVPTDAAVFGPLALPANLRVALAIRDGERAGEVFVLPGPRVVIGRTGGDAQADLELPDAEVSRTHALVECHGERTVLRDLGSRNGTFVGSARIAEADLENGDEFRVGRTTLALQVAPRA